VSVKVKSAEPAIAIAPAPSGPSVVSSVVIALWVVTFTPAELRVERRPCTVVLLRAVSRWYFREFVNSTAMLSAEGRMKLAKSDLSIILQSRP
jgi:hypothetical protein